MLFSRVQFKEVHGMLGCPARNAKTLVITENEEMARRLVFVISYFIRCSQIFERRLNFLENDKESFGSALNISIYI